MILDLILNFKFKNFAGGHHWTPPPPPPDWPPLGTAPPANSVQRSCVQRYLCIVCYGYCTLPGATSRLSPNTVRSANVHGLTTRRQQLGPHWETLARPLTILSILYCISPEHCWLHSQSGTSAANPYFSVHYARSSLEISILAGNLLSADMCADVSNS